MGLLVGRAEIAELEQTLFDVAIDFGKRFEAEHGELPFCDVTYEHINPIWTCFINGKGKGYQLNSWEGVFRIWMQRILENAGLHLDDDNLTIKPESWYRMDMALVDQSQGDWGKGKYKIELVFQQENDPAEVAGHLREFYDLVVPNKILLIWTDHRIRQVCEVLRRADEVIDFCAANRIYNLGRIVLVIGDWSRTWPALEKGEKPDSSIFTTRIVG